MKGAPTHFDQDYELLDATGECLSFTLLTLFECLPKENRVKGEVGGAMEKERAQLFISIQWWLLFCFSCSLTQTCVRIYFLNGAHC